VLDACRCCGFPACRAFRLLSESHIRLQPQNYSRPQHRRVITELTQFSFRTAPDKGALRHSAWSHAHVIPTILLFVVIPSPTHLPERCPKLGHRVPPYAPYPTRRRTVWATQQFLKAENMWLRAFRCLDVHTVRKCAAVDVSAGHAASIIRAAVYRLTLYIGLLTATCTVTTQRPLATELRWTALTHEGHAVAHCATSRSSRVRFPMVSLEFFIHIILPALGLTLLLTETSTRNISWGVKGAGA
jgi:hypothetical protein